MSLTNLDCFFHDIAVGDYCSSGDTDCPGPVMVTRVVGAQAHAVCQHHGMQVRLPANLVKGFNGESVEAGEYVIARAEGAAGPVGSQLVQSSSAVRSRLGIDEFPRTPGYMHVAYDDKGALQLRFRASGSGQAATIDGKYLDRFPEHVQGHLMDGYGVLCSLDLANVSNVTWPEYPLNVPVIDTFEKRLSA